MKYTLLIIWVVLLLASCYEDKSTLPGVEYPSIVVNRNDDESFLTCQYAREFIYEPQLGREAGTEVIALTPEEYDDYTYLWKLTLVANGNDTTSEVLSRERILKAVIHVTPTASVNYYTLILQVVHKASGVTKNFSWKVKVSSVFAAGVLLSETSDEQTTDISLVMSRTYNEGLKTYDEDVVHHNIFSRVNGTNLEGVVSSMSYLTFGGDYSAITTLVEGKSIVRTDPVSMKVMDRDEELFFYPPTVYNPQVTLTATYGYYGVLINDGIVQFFETSRGTKYSYVPEADYDIAKAYAAVAIGWDCDVMMFDKKHSKFVQLSTWNGGIIDLPPVSGGVFDPGNLPDVECIYGDAGSDWTVRWLMKKEGQYYIYEVSADDFTGLRIYDMGRCTDLDKSDCFAFSAAYPEFYYGSGDKLYVVLLNEDQPESKIAYNKFGVGEKVTHLLFHKGEGYTTWSEQYNATSGKEEPVWRKAENNVMTVVTYHEGTHEGKVYSLPIQYGGAGGIANDKYVRCYDGFGRITAITTHE